MITLYIILGVVIWYIIGFLSLIVGNYSFEERKTITVKDLVMSFLGVFIFACLLLGMIIHVSDSVGENWDKVIFDFSKKK